MNFVVPTIVLLFASLSLEAHSGRTDSNGCHNDRKSGGYHCHGGGNSKTSTDSYWKQKRRTPVRNVKRLDGGQAALDSMYSRKSWRHWVDEDGDCQNTRAEVLIRDSIIPVTFHTAKKCRVKSGEWLDPYTLTFYDFASEVDIEHVVPLKNAHESGGRKWSRERKRKFANDQQNLLVVSRSENRRKGSRGPASYQPPNKHYWCQYARKWSLVKEKYSLVSSFSEMRALKGMCIN